MFNAEAIKQFLLVTVVPVLSGGLAVWIAGTKVAAVFGITANAAAAEITQVLTFGIVAGIAYLASHHILSGHYAPAAKAAAKARKSDV